MTKEVFEKFNIHSSYNDFFDNETVNQLDVIFSQIEKSSFTPSRENIFKALQKDMFENKVVLLGMDPYPQEGVATGLAFQVNRDSWNDKAVNTSLKNILKLLYKTYTGKVESINNIRAEITAGSFEIQSPKELFTRWQAEGVLLLNAALTTEIGKPGAHIKYWKKFVIKLIKYIDANNKDLIWLLWGGKAQQFEKYIIHGNLIQHNHPAICGKLDNPNDFMNGISFSATKEIVEWI